MKVRIAAALALTVATSLHAQAVPTASATTAASVDYSTATPLDGNWRYSSVTGGSEATFVNAAAQQQLTIGCTRATRQVTISRPASGASAFLAVWTTALSRNLPASYNPAMGRLSATMSAYDPVLDAIAFSRGRAAIGLPGQAPLILPTWAEVARVIEDCRA